MPGPVLDFWFDFASTYSYPAAARIGPLAAEAGVQVRFRPFLLGPIFKAQGWDTSPFNLYPAKGRNMWRDLERLCEDTGLPFRRPEPFPQNSLLAGARCACRAWREGWGEAFSRRGLPRAVRRRAQDRRARDARRDPVGPECRCQSRTRAPHSRTTTSCGCARRPRRRSGSACSARRPSSPPAANCSGATTGWSRRCAGPSAEVGCPAQRTYAR